MMAGTGGHVPLGSEVRRPGSATDAVRTAEPNAAHVALEGKYLTFFLAGEEYGVEILKVREIVALLPVTRVPRTPHFIKGLVNLRGRVVAVIDLRTRFQMPPAELLPESCIIVVQTVDFEMGLIVDRMSVVQQVYARDIDDVPAFGVQVDTDFLLGIGKCDGRVILLLNIERVLTREETQALSEFNTQIQATNGEVS